MTIAANSSSEPELPNLCTAQTAAILMLGFGLEQIEEIYNDQADTGSRSP